MKEIELFSILGRIAIDNEMANDEIDETTENAESAENKISKAFEKIGKAVVTYFAVDRIIAFGTACVEAAAEVAANEAQFEQVFGDYSEAAETALQKVADSTGVLDTRLTPTFTSIAARFKGLGENAETATAIAEKGCTLAADAAAFYDVAVEDAAGSIGSFLNGNYEAGDALGLYTNATQLASWYTQQYGGNFDDLTESQKQQMRLNYMQYVYDLNGATGQAAREQDGYANVTGNLNGIMTNFKATLGDLVLPTVINLMIAFTDFIDKISEGVTWLKEHETAVTLLGVAIGTITALVIAYNVQQALANTNMTLWGTIAAAGTTVTTALGAAFTFLTSPIGLVILALGAAVAGGIALYKNWDTVKEKATYLWEKIKEVFDNIKEKVGGVVDAIKGFFNFDWELPKIKLPHFKVTGSANPLKWLSEGTPKLAVEWYAKGGVLNEPTVFGVNPVSNSAMVGGEAGPEAIAPIDTLLGYIKEAVKDENKEMAALLKQLIELLPQSMKEAVKGLGGKVYLDDEEVGDYFIDKLEREVGYS